MRMFLVLLFSICVTVNSQAQERIQTEKLDPATTKNRIHEAISNYQSIKKLGTEVTYVQKKFRNNAEFHIFYTPSLTGNLHIFVVNESGELIRERETVLFQESPKFEYRTDADTALLCYQWRTLREVGPGLSRRQFERRVELYSGSQNTVLRIAGDIEHHSHGQKGAAYSFYVDQRNKCSFNGKEIVLNYKYQLWEDTGNYQSESFLTKVKPDENKEFDIYFTIKGNDFYYDAKRSGKATESSMRLYPSDPYKIEKIKY